MCGKGPGKRLANLIVVGSLLGAHGGLLAWIALVHSPTIDEVGHLPAGISYWYFGRFELYCVNPPLTRLAAALPVVFQHPETPWFGFFVGPGARSELAIGRQFIAANGSRSFWLFATARWACIPFSLLGAYICLRWARDLYGDAAGWMALMLWCFSPNILAHGSLVTADVPAAALAAAAGYAFWRWLESPGWSQAFVAGVVLGVAELTKFTLLIFLPLWPLMWFIWRWPGRHSVRCAGWLREGSQMAVILLLTLYTINVGYAFDGSFRALGSFRFISRPLAGPLGDLDAISTATGNRFAGRCLGRLPVPLPAPYVIGIDAQGRDFEWKFSSYLGGRWRKGGWWYYYLYALAVKVPLGTWFLLLVALVAGIAAPGYAASWRRETVLLAPLAAIMVLVSSQTGVQYLRYALPISSFAFVWVSKVARAIKLGQRKVALATGAALAWSILSSLAVCPHSLSYFNELAGGAKNGHWHLLDSNIDWGQDLLYLRRWYEAHPNARPLGLAVFASFDPAVAGVPCVTVPRGPPDTLVAVTDTKETGPLPGWFAVSVNNIHSRAREYDYFLHFTPVATAGYSIHIYHITVAEANRVRRELGLPELAEVEGRLK